MLYPALSAARTIIPSALPQRAQVKPFELDEITIAELQDGMKSGKFTARSLVEKYPERIDEIDKRGPAVNAIIELNPDALRRSPTPLTRSAKPKGRAGRCTASRC